MNEDELQEQEIDITEYDFVDRSEVAIQKIRDVVKGNIFHPLEDVELISYEEVILEFEAENRFILHTDRVERVTPKTPPGVKKVNSKTDLDTVAEKDVENISTQETPLTELKAEILKREDRGYFLDNERIPLALDPLAFLREEPCQLCRGQRYIECNHCQGRGYKKCHGCQGKGLKNCNTCKGRGEIQCVKCQTKGKRECHNCRAFGKVNYLTLVRLSADSNFSYDKESVPEVIINVLERIREKLITKGHSMYAIGDDIKAKEKDNADSILTLKYHVRLPLADAVFRVGKEYVPALVFGYKTALLDVPPFLERYILKPFSLIQEAAKGQGNVAGKMRAAAYQTRLTNETIMGVATIGAAATERKLRNKYSIALEPAFIRNLVKSTRAALNKLTTKPQFIGLAVGLIPSFILTMIYVSLICSNTTDLVQPVRLVMDAVFLLFSTFFPYFCAQVMSRQALIYALGHGVRHRIKLPKLGMRGLWGPIIAICLFLYFSETVYQNNPIAAPEIFSVLRNLIP